MRIIFDTNDYSFDKIKNNIKNFFIDIRLKIEWKLGKYQLDKE